VPTNARCKKKKVKLAKRGHGFLWKIEGKHPKRRGGGSNSESTFGKGAVGVEANLGGKGNVGKGIKDN